MRRKIPSIHSPGIFPKTSVIIQYLHMFSYGQRIGCVDLQSKLQTSIYAGIFLFCPYASSTGYFRRFNLSINVLLSFISG